MIIWYLSRKLIISRNRPVSAPMRIWKKILEALEKTKVRLRANVNFELALELLFLTIREK